MLFRSSGLDIYCTLDDEAMFHQQKWDAYQLMQYVFQKIDACDTLLVLIRSQDKSEGMGVEFGYALAKGKKLVVVKKKGVTTSCIAQLANKLIEYDNIDDIPQKLESIGWTSVPDKVKNPTL